MRIARFTVGDNPQYGVVEGEPGAEVISLITGDPLYTAIQPTGQRVPLAEVRLLAPVLPSKVVAVGRNYAEHARELGNEVPPEPVLFLKPSTSVIGPGDPILRPEGVGRVDFEGELAKCQSAGVDRVSPFSKIAQSTPPRSTSKSRYSPP